MQICELVSWSDVLLKKLLSNYVTEFINFPFWIQKMFPEPKSF